MVNEQVLNFGILAVAGVLLLIGLLMVLSGLFGRTPRGQYQVERLQARRAAMVHALKGVGVLAVGAILLGFWSLFQFGTSNRANQPEPTTAAPVPTATAVTTDLLAPTATPLPDPTELPTIVEVAPTVAATLPPPTPTAIPPQPTPTATDVPTATPIPYDAYVNVVGGLNMRDTPNGVVTVLLPNGTGVTLLNEAIAAGPYLWQKVISETGAEGWVAEEFIEYSQ